LIWNSHLVFHHPWPWNLKLHLIKSDEIKKLNHLACHAIKKPGQLAKMPYCHYIHIFTWKKLNNGIFTHKKIHNFCVCPFKKKHSVKVSSRKLFLHVGNLYEIFNDGLHSFLNKRHGGTVLFVDNSQFRLFVFVRKPIQSKSYKHLWLYHGCNKCQRCHDWQLPKKMPMYH